MSCTTIRLIHVLLCDFQYSNTCWICGQWLQSFHGGTESDGSLPAPLDVVNGFTAQIYTSHNSISLVFCLGICSIPGSKLRCGTVFLCHWRQGKTYLSKIFNAENKSRRKEPGEPSDLWLMDAGGIVNISKHMDVGQNGRPRGPQMLVQFSINHPIIGVPNFDPYPYFGCVSWPVNFHMSENHAASSFSGGFGHASEVGNWRVLSRSEADTCHRRSRLVRGGWDWHGSECCRAIPIYKL